MEEDLSPIGAMEAVLDVLGGSTQWVVAGSVGAVLVTEADVDALVWVLGSLLNAGFAKSLKKAINQVRTAFKRLALHAIGCSIVDFRSLRDVFPLDTPLSTWH